MHTSLLYRRSLAYHWRSNVATVFGVMAGTAALAGALLVGDSMRGSLRDLAVGRLGRIDYALVAGRFFREATATEMAASREFDSHFAQVCPAIVMRGGASHANSGARVNRVNILGVDGRFWKLDPRPEAAGTVPTSGRSVVLNETLARELGAETGDDILLRFEKQSRVSAETLLGRRDRRTSSLRLTVRRIVSDKGLGGFDLHPTQRQPFIAYVPLPIVQRAIKQRGRVNALLVAGKPDADAPDDIESLHALFRRYVKLDDLGLKLRGDDKRGYVSVESESLLIEPAIEPFVLGAAQAVGGTRTAVLTYLANTIARVPGKRLGSPPTTTPDAAPAERLGIPYSMVSAVDLSSPSVRASLSPVGGGPAPVLGDGEILLNEWAANDLQAKIGEAIRLTYYVTGSFGRLDTQSATFVLRGVVSMRGLGGDPGLTPEYEGITDADGLADWDPPFPIDLKRIRDKDEAYWDAHRTTPKAFVSLAAGQKLWAQTGTRFGRLTSIRVVPADAKDLALTTESLERELLKRVDPVALGLSFEPVKARALAAGKGSTDFGMLFIGFSFFVIASAAMFVALMFRLGVERRSAEVGILLATGYAARTVRRLLLAEGTVLAALGSAIGLLGGVAYAWLMLAGLGSWWSSAVNAPFLRLHVSPVSLVIGFIAGVAVALISILWAVRGLSRSSVRSLLAGATGWGFGPACRGRGRLARWIAVGAAAAVVILTVASLVTDTLPEAPTFFVSGAAMLVVCLAALSAWLAGRGDGENLESTTLGVVRLGVARLGIRNAARNPGRSMLTTGLIASATFLIVAVGANRHEAGHDVHEKTSGTGGFSLLAESSIPILHDLNSTDGREAVRLSDSATRVLDSTKIMPFRLRPGDESSCLNLYQPRQPRILGATEKMIQRGGFQFRSSLAETAAQNRNPWALLTEELPDGAVPAIGDYNTVMWLLHLGLGKDLVITDEWGNDVPLRIVALLAGSVLQGELIVAESRFVELFPSVDGYSFFLIESPTAGMAAVRNALEGELADYGLDVTSTVDRLNDYLAVENTYLSTFQTLGGLGLILGTFGMAAVLLRNVWERRAELALLRALGFRRSALGWMVLAENSVLLVAGLAAGTVSALLAVAPHAVASPALVPWGSLALTLLSVLLIGLLAGAVALFPTLRAPLLPALRSE